jgi:hypothetical protein
MESLVELARQQWEESYRRLAGTPAADIDTRVLEQIEAVTQELRRRIGSTFTLTDLAVCYDGSEQWTHTAISERFPRPGWARSASAASDAAFHLFARGARDYRP